MKVGVIGGGFKPPHKGHYQLAKQALAQVPDLDKMIIYVGKNVRDGIDQSQSVAIWNLYKDSLGSNVEIVPASKAPIGHIYSYASNNPEDEVYWFLGARDEEDRADIADRTSYLEKNREKYPNLNVEVVESTGTDVSGTAARRALKAGDKESFFDFIPDVVDKDKVYDIVKTPETKMADAIDELFANFMYEEQNVNFDHLEKVLDDMFEDLDIDINFTSHFKERVIERGLTEEDIIELMQKIHDKYPDELDFLGAGENRVFTHLSKLVDIAAVNKGYGDDYLKDLVLKTAYKRNSPKEPEFRTNASSPKLAVAEITKGSHVAPIAVLPSEERQKLQNYTKILQDALPDEFDVEYRQDHIRVSVPYFDKNKNHQDDWTPHQRQLPEEVAEETIGQFDFAPHIASILEYCMTKGMKVTPIPEVKIRRDEENAANLFGRTGYYQPDTQEIVLYVTGRHPKDVLRSFCHELIHHMQNLEGKNLTFYTTDIHADENLKEIEQEAHAKGSFLFRDWENSNKEQAPVDESLWANINAKKKAGKKSSHKNSNAYKAAKSAGEELEKTKESVNELALFESLSRAQKEDLVRQIIRLQKDHGSNIEKIAARLTLPASLTNKLRSTGVSFGKRFVEAVLEEQKRNLEEGTKYRSIVVDVRKAINNALNTLLKGEQLSGYNLPVKREPTEEHRELAEKYGFSPLGLMLNIEKQTAYLGAFQSKSEKGTPTEVEVSLKFALSDEVKKGRFYIDGEASSDEGSIDIILAFNPQDGTNMLQKIQPTLTDLIRHETEHLTQSGVEEKPTKWMRGDQAKRLKIRQNPELFYKYFLLPKEVDANIQGLYAKSKYEKNSFQDTVDAYLTDLVGDGVITQANSKQIYNKWKTRAAEIGGIPELK